MHRCARPCITAARTPRPPRLSSRRSAPRRFCVSPDHFASRLLLLSFFFFLLFLLFLFVIYQLCWIRKRSVRLFSPHTLLSISLGTHVIGLAGGVPASRAAGRKSPGCVEAGERRVHPRCAAHRKPQKPLEFNHLLESKSILYLYIYISVLSFVVPFM